MNTDTHYNPGGGGTAYAVRKNDVEIQAGDRVRTVSGPGLLPVYGTVEKVGPYNGTFLIALDNGLKVTRDLGDVTFHGRPHPAFNTGRDR